MATATASVRLGRPETVTWAVILSVVPTVLSLPSFLLPGGNELDPAAFVISVVLATATCFGAWGLWNCRKWGAIVTAVPLGINVLTSIPGAFMAPSGWFLASIVILTPLAIVALILIFHRNSRAVYR